MFDDKTLDELKFELCRLSAQIKLEEERYKQAERILQYHKHLQERIRDIVYDIEDQQIAAVTYGRN